MIIALLVIVFSIRESNSVIQLPALENNQLPGTDFGFDYQTLLADIDFNITDGSVILSVLALSTEACTPCLNNVADYRDAINTDEAI